MNTSCRGRRRVDSEDGYFGADLFGDESAKRLDEGALSSARWAGDSDPQTRLRMHLALLLQVMKYEIEQNLSGLLFNRIRCFYERDGLGKIGTAVGNQTIKQLFALLFMVRCGS